MNNLFKSGIFWTITTALVGIGLTISFYELSKKERTISYYIKKESSKIFDSQKSTSNIQVCTLDSSIIQKNVYVINLALWNSGDLEIKKTDVRKPITITKTKDTQILDYSIVNSIEPKISNFKIIKSYDSLLIDWEFFDPKFGLEVQVIYSGNDNSKIGFDGYILGSKVKEVKNEKLNGVARILPFMILAIFIGLVFDLRKQYLKDGRVWTKYFTIQSALLSIGFIVLIWGICKVFFIGVGAPI